MPGRRPADSEGSPLPGRVEAGPVDALAATRALDRSRTNEPTTLLGVSRQVVVWGPRTELNESLRATIVLDLCALNLADSCADGLLGGPTGGVTQGAPPGPAFRRGRRSLFSAVPHRPRSAGSAFSVRSSVGADRRNPRVTQAR
ncbi:hypothetical protein GCM10027590_08410 [Nocardiopsis nanhaiensis]